MTSKILTAIAQAKDVLATVRKALVPAVVAAGVVLGTDSPVLADVLAVLTALGVYVVPNAE